MLPFFRSQVFLLLFFIKPILVQLPVSYSGSGWYPSCTAVDRSRPGTIPGLKGDNARCHSPQFYL